MSEDIQPEVKPEENQEIPNLDLESQEEGIEENLDVLGDIQEETQEEAQEGNKGVKSKSKEKPTVLMLPLGGCNGCHVTFLDLHEQLLDVFPMIDLKRASVVADMNKYTMPEVDIALVEGAVCNEDQLRLLREARKKAKILIALGSCAAFGGVPGLRNYFDVNEVIDEAYVNALSNDNPDKVVPDDYPTVPKMLDEVACLDRVVKVDFIIPGCPPVPETIKETIVAYIEGREPEIATKNLCEDCHRNHKKIIPADRQFITMSINAVLEKEIDPDLCFLEQGILCMGPATRSGCGGRCTSANMPCRGCFGPNPEAIEQGCEMTNAMAPMLPIGALINKEDLPGTFYRYALPSSIIPTVVKNHNEIVKKQLARDKLLNEE